MQIRDYQEGDIVTDHGSSSKNDATSEILATTGLFSLVSAVMVGVFAVAALGAGATATAAMLAAGAVVAFAASIACFLADGRRAEAAPLPFPSLLRTETESVH